MIAVAVEAWAIDKFEAHKRAKEEFLQAEQVMSRKQSTSSSIQKDMDKLAEQKTLWEREVVFSKNRLSVALEKLDSATKLGSVDEIDRLKREVGQWEIRMRSADAELQKVDKEVQATMIALQKSLSSNVENALILPGESLEVMVMEDESLNGLYQVRRGGYVIMPRVGRIPVAGKDLGGAEKAIKEALAVSQIKDSTVMVERTTAGHTQDGPVIYLAGEFKTPGPWKIPQGVSPTTVTTVLRSGGVSGAADLTKVRVLRLANGQPLVEEVNVKAILDGVGLTPDLNLNPGDIVMIPAYANVIYVTGNVQKPGVLKLLPDDELTAYSAILRSGGFARFANRTKVYILREMGNGVKERIPVNIKGMPDGQSKDVILLPKDIVVVPEKFFSF